MEIKIERSDNYVSIEVENATYLFHRATYNALFHAILQNPADDVVWVSCVTADLVPDPEDCGGLIDELNDFVDRAVFDLTPVWAKCRTCSKEYYTPDMVPLANHGDFDCESCHQKNEAI
jgi:hypothetical protein